MEARIHVVVVAIALVVLFAFSSIHESSAQSQQLSDAEINTLLENLRSRGFFTGATILSYSARTYLAPRSTLLIPTDKALAKAVSIEPQDYMTLIKFHILETDLDFNQLRVLPVGTWIPTALQGYGVKVTENSEFGFSLDNAQVISADICPCLANISVSCHGVSALLNPKSESSEMPKNPPLFAPAPKPLQGSSPSPPMASEPSASPSPSASSSPSISPVPPSPVFQAPISSPLAPTSPLQFPPFFAEEPSPSPTVSSGALPTVTSQINTLALATLGGILVAMI